MVKKPKVKIIKTRTRIKGKKRKDALYIEDLPNVMRKVKEIMKEQELNPAMIKEEDAGVVHIDGKPMMIVGNEYIPYGNAQLIFQARKVVREYLRLKKLKEIYE